MFVCITETGVNTAEIAEGVKGAAERMSAVSVQLETVRHASKETSRAAGDVTQATEMLSSGTVRLNNEAGVFVERIRTG